MSGDFTEVKQEFHYCFCNRNSVTHDNSVYCVVKKIFICIIKYNKFVIFKFLIYIDMLQTDLIKGSIRTIVLKLLKENGRMYGYEITRKVEDLTAGRIKLTYGALYPVLHKLENEGVLVTEPENYNNRIRIYYSLTEKGHSVVAEKIREMAEFIDSLQRIVNPQTGLSNA